MMITPRVKLKSPKTIDQHFSESQLIKLLLSNRGIKPPFKKFLSPQPPKSDFLDFSPSVKFIQKYLTGNILIYGDYDVDGITSTAILWQTLTSLGAVVYPFIPSRHHHGYGFNFFAFKDYVASKKINIDLIITVDNGIVANKEISKAKKAGYKLMIIDHHLADQKKPPADHILHSTQLSAAGLTWAFCHHLSVNPDLGLAALGTVADCLPLTDLNRQIVFHGLISLRQQPSLGLKKLIEISGAKQANLSAYDLGFLLSPRINAAGRLFDPTDALRLLCSQNTLQAAKYAQILDKNNSDRQQIQQISQDKIINQYQPQNNKIIFVSEKSLDIGIIGLIAGRLTEKFHLPSIVIAQSPDFSKGSCRSVAGVNLISLLRRFKNLFTELGGHSAAAGFTIPTKNIPILEDKIKKYLQKKSLSPSRPTIEVEALITPQALTLANARIIQKLQPFGVGNPTPLFLLSQPQISRPRVVGKNQDHLQMTVNNNIGAIAFKQAPQHLSGLSQGHPVDLVASLEINTYNGRSQPQLIVKEIIPK